MGIGTRIAQPMSLDSSKALGLAAPVLLGHSMGGMTAAVVASQLATAIRGVILADPHS